MSDKYQPVRNNRITQSDEAGNWKLKKLVWNQLHVGAVITEEVWEILYGALAKLKGYEDTGLSPEQVEYLIYDCSLCDVNEEKKNDNTYKSNK